MYRMDWEDLCMGPHVPSTGVIGAFKVTSIASSHWHGDVNSDRFQRVYGTAFFAQEDLDAYLAQLEEAKQRDHRVIGHKLNLFTIDEQVGQGLILWKPRGAMVRARRGLAEPIDRRILQLALNDPTRAGCVGRTGALCDDDDCRSQLAQRGERIERIITGVHRSSACAHCADQRIAHGAGTLDDQHIHAGCSGRGSRRSPLRVQVRGRRAAPSSCVESVKTRSS